MKIRKILLVEDNKSDSELALRAFSKSNLLNPIEVVEDGQEAMDYLCSKGRFAERNKRETPAFVLLDLKLPVLDGFEVLKQIRACEDIKRIPVVIMTSSKEEEDLVKSYDLGVNSYIQKPVDFTEFVNTIQQLGLYWSVLNETPSNN